MNNNQFVDCFSPEDCLTMSSKKNNIYIYMYVCMCVCARMCGVYLCFLKHIITTLFSCGCFSVSYFVLFVLHELSATESDLGFVFVFVTCENLLHVVSH